MGRAYAVSRDILVSAGTKYGAGRVNRMAAAVAYRTVFALAPLFIISVSVLGAIVGGSDEAKAEIISTVSGVAGSQVAKFVESLLSSALEAGNTAAVIGIILLFWSASSLFLELQHDLNDIFEVPYERVSGLANFAKKRGIGFLWAFGLGLMTLAVWLLNAIWRFVEGLLPESLTGLHAVVGLLAPLVSLAILPFTFGLIFQTMTVVRLPWRAVWWGGLFTALVFTLAAYGIGLYFTVFSTPTALGFASSFVVVLFLAYLLSTVFLFGAVMTKLYSDHLARAEGAVSAKPEIRPGILVAGAPASVPKAAILAFLGGLAVGWRRSKR